MDKSELEYFDEPDLQKQGTIKKETESPFGKLYSGQPTTDLIRKQSIENYIEEEEIISLALDFN